MQRVVLKALVFACGVVLAFGLAYGSQRLHQRTLDANSTPTAPVTLVAPPASSRPQAQPINNPLRALSAAARRSRLEQAIQEGTLDSMQLLSPQILRGLPDYRSVTLPVVKESLLLALIAKFSEQDWIDWPRAAFAHRNGPTPARSFVDDVRIVNSDLGRYLETAGYLFHVLYLRSMQGEPVNLREEALNLTRNAERILANRKVRAVPARALLEPEIVSDTVFVREFERKRGDFILFYAAEHPQELERQLILLLGLDGNFATAEHLTSIADILRTSALSGSPRFRDRVLRLTVESPSVQLFIERSPRIRRALAELYLIGVVDALEEHDTRRALLFLNQSIAVQPGLRAQELLAKSIQSNADKLVLEGNEEGDGSAAEAGSRSKSLLAADDERSRESGAGEESASEESEQEASEEGGTSSVSLPERGRTGSGGLSIFSLLVVAVIGGVVVMVVLYRRGVKLSAPPTPAVPSAKPASVRMTSPSAVDFGPEPEIANRGRN